ncbi:hypothetical protein UPYG_G00178050 [Umbra pygmaea]|uniref:Fibronectin type-III domain-containing protein n=1 Tax=Umbra pygmaea TaxID=75934 RepID=A0ABD0XF98_UMBPY
MCFSLLHREYQSWIVTCLFIFSYAMMNYHSEEHQECHQVHELVKLQDLKHCTNDERTCVTDESHCGPRSHISHDLVNISCYFQPHERTIQCIWSPECNIKTKSMYSLIFSKTTAVYSCKAIFNPMAKLNVTIRIENQMNGIEFWSDPHEVILHEAIKPPPPNIISVIGTDNSLKVMWKKNDLYNSCRLRYRRFTTGKWIQIPFSVPEDRNETVSHTIEGLKHYSRYSIAISCIYITHWSDWSIEINGTTSESGK